ncbi:nucleotidyltransferase family protein [Ornithobacterium rhinotracheale]|uniref:nucleotidyltransferase family protein n=1 Tax=Ornithobacterium rhinotracheale TaxID=28251 RepID=UPI001FF355CD|nr:sugar phosphate nucleotidyltransferase [Ornithobacterium rhinotracheale]MCK0206104.1 sugar phosphate nucleotidyltransferase [Ornithobacterium rhinotracheale]
MSDTMTLMVLAGGLGSRYKGQKQVDPVGDNGECLMEFGLYDAINNGVNHVVFIINDQLSEEIKEHLRKPLDERGIKVDFVLQAMPKAVPEKYADLVPLRQKPWGTAHAVLMAKDVIHQPFIVMNADDYYGANTFELAHELVKAGKIDVKNYGMVAFELEKTLSDNGTVSRGVCEVEDGKLKKVTEILKIIKKDNGEIVNEADQPEKVDLQPKSKVSMNFWILDHTVFPSLQEGFEEFLSKIENKEKQEYFIPLYIDNQIQKGELNVWVEQSKEDWFGMTYPEDKQLVVDDLKQKTQDGKYNSPLWKK